MFHILYGYQYFGKYTIVFLPKNWNIKLDTLVNKLHFQ